MKSSNKKLRETGVFIALACGFFTLQAQDTIPVKTDTSQMARIVFEKTVHDFGTMTQGGETICSFTFSNAGKAPLIISHVKSDCGCSIPSWPKEPILPGKTGKITVIYNKSQWGPIIKSVTVTSNASNPAVVLKLKGEVKKR